jgi:hypothetical protein
MTNWEVDELQNCDFKYSYCPKCIQSLLLIAMRRFNLRKLYAVICEEAAFLLFSNFGIS